ncbi:MAG: metallophosphoesterase [Chitinophagaceae bacterium]
MKKQLTFLLALFATQCSVMAQQQIPIASEASELFFVSDTQQPMWVEKILLRPHENLRATADIFEAILLQKPKNLFMLGDVVSLGFANRKWKKVDQFLDSCRKEGTQVCGLLGNHDVMGRRKKGELNFQKRFPMNVRTGYMTITDSVAIIMLNSNFKTLSILDIANQQAWYKKTMMDLDADDTVRAIIVCCHHAPFTNSKMVGCSVDVQENFVPDYVKSKKARLFITGHCHAFEHFKMKGKDFLVIGGGGGLRQPLNVSKEDMTDLASDYKPRYHYLSVKRIDDNLLVTSHFLKEDFNGFETGMTFNTKAKAEHLAITKDELHGKLAN